MSIFSKIIKSGGMPTSSKGSKVLKKKVTVPIVKGGMSGTSGNYHSGGVMYNSNGKAIGSSAITKPGDKLSKLQGQGASLRKSVSNFLKGNTNQNTNLPTGGMSIGTFVPPKWTIQALVTQAIRKI